MLSHKLCCYMDCLFGTVVVVVVVVFIVVSVIVFVDFGTLVTKSPKSI